MEPPKTYHEGSVFLIFIFGKDKAQDESKNQERRDTGVEY